MVEPLGSTHTLMLTRTYRQHAAFFYTLVLSVFLFATLLSNNAQAQVTGSWEPVDTATIEQGSRFYDRNSRAYYTDNTVQIGGDTASLGELRLVVSNSSFPVNNATGSMSDGSPYFTMSGPMSSQRIYFTRTRGAFSYSLQVMQFVEDTTDSDNDGIPDDTDICPLDPDNDIDGDGICGDVDTCPLDANNDADDDGLCAADDICPLDPNNDADGDGICGDVDVCPADPDNDIDDDGLCASEDTCPLDPDNDIDGDGVCGDVDSCPLDADNDLDSDGICGDVDACPTDPLNDDDSDNICDSEDFCLDDPTNMCILVTGFVSGGGSALEGAMVELGLGGPMAQTEMDGSFSGNVGPDALKHDGSSDFVPVKVKAAGFSTGNVKVKVVQDKFDYDVTVNLQQVSDTLDENDDVTADGGVIIVKDGSPVGSLEIPASSLPDGANQVSGTITYLDPETDDLLSTPGGDLLALPVGADPNNDDPVTLESFGMMEFNLKDENGNEITELNGLAEVCMRAPSGLAENDVVPLWYYDEEQGLWIEEGEGTVELRDDELVICGQVGHFSWWNYDQPITTHSCLRYDMRDEDTGDSLNDLNWYAEGATYNGSSPSRSCLNNADNFNAFTVKISTDADPESIRVYTFLGTSKFYLHSDEDGTYSLTSDVAQAMVFPTPDENGSCLTGTLNGMCWLLDYQDAGADGVLPIDVTNINLPPVITEFMLNESLLLIGESMDVSVTVTDPDGDDVILNWETDCGYYGDSSGGSMATNPQSGASGDNFTNTFTAPAALSYPVEYCQIELTATDLEGASSVASRWLTVAASFNYDISGTVYGTDGLPASYVTVDYYNWDCEELNQSTGTSSEGEFYLSIDLQTCGLDSGDEFYTSGYLVVYFEKDGQYWAVERYLDSYYYGGVELTSASLSGVALQDPGCLLNDDGSTSCYFDIVLPTLWAEVSGDILNNPYLEEVNLGYSSYETAGGYYNSSVWLADYFPIQPSDTSYAPLTVPVGAGEFYLYGPTADSDNDYRYFDIYILNQANQIRDIGEYDQVPLQVTVYDYDGDPVSGSQVSSFSYNGGESVDDSGTTDASGMVNLVTGLGYLDGSASDVANSDTYYFDGHVDQWDVTKIIDVNGPDMCMVKVTVFDEFAALVEGVEFVWYGNLNPSNLNLVTDENGQASFMAHPGYVSIDGYYGPYFYRGFEIDNCRMVGGEPRTIEVDITAHSNDNYYGDF